MARAKNGSLFSEINGSIGGIVCQQGISGQIIRTKTSRVIKRNEYTAVPRTITNQLQQAWKALSSSDRQQWALWASFIGWKQANNPNRLLSGYQCFAKVNYYRILYAAALITTPVFDSTQPPDFNNAFGINSGSLNFLPGINMSTEVCFAVIMATFPLSNSVTNAENKLKFLCTDGNSGPYIDVNSYYISRFGHQPVLAERILFKTCLINIVNGVPTPWKLTYTNLDTI